jgi:hypothetical protein
MIININNNNNNNHRHEKLKFHTPDFVINKHNTYATLQTSLYSGFIHFDTMQLKVSRNNSSLLSPGEPDDRKTGFETETESCMSSRHPEVR